MSRETEIATWGRIIDAKCTGLPANGGRICSLCGNDAGVNPIRLTFYGHQVDRYFHRDCAVKLKNEDGTFFANIATLKLLS